MESQPYDSATPVLEILEAGTGHASLTLHLARAVHAANQNVEASPAPLISHTSMGATTERPLRHRQAIVHTIDISPSHSQHAQPIVSGFRHGMYSKNIDFHVGDVSEWIRQTSAARGLSNSDKTIGEGENTTEDDQSGAKAFLSHIILDMPDAHNHIETATSALLVNGGLVVFNPSITQIMTVVKMIKEKYLPLQLDRVLELGQQMTGGKEWDVRCVKPRARVQASTATATAAGDESSELDKADEEEAENWEMICRPKVGDRISGGGFVALYKKMKR